MEKSTGPPEHLGKKVPLEQLHPVPSSSAKFELQLLTASE
jgi:hypothetical protein